MSDSQTKLRLGSLVLVGKPSEHFPDAAFYVRVQSSADARDINIRMTPSEWSSLLAIASVVEAAVVWVPEFVVGRPQVRQLDNATGRLIRAIDAISSLAAGGDK